MAGATLRPSRSEASMPRSGQRTNPGWNGPAVKAGHQVLFSVWGWLALPLLAGAIVLAFSAGAVFGVSFVLMTAGWLFHMGSTACSRCGFYGTGRCGVQAWGVALLWKRKPAASASLARLRLHFVLDIVMMVAGAGAYAQSPILLSLFLAWVGVGWWVVYGPKRYHALLHRLPAGLAPPRPGVVGAPAQFFQGPRFTG